MNEKMKKMLMMAMAKKKNKKKTVMKKDGKQPVALLKKVDRLRKK